MIKVSVIVPVYNVERYLRKCLDSLSAQTLRDIEIILVSDASPDNSAEIMREYEIKDTRIRCIYLDINLKMGGARNRGVEIAKGEYLTFVDSDDYLEPSMLEIMYEKAAATGSDLVYGVYHYTRENGDIIKDVCLYPPEFDGELTAGKKKGVINKLAFPWGKLFRRSVWMENNISFPEKMIYEDGPTVPLAILYMHRCAFAEDAYYYYVLHDESAMNRKNSRNHMDNQKAALVFKQRMIERGLYPQYKEETDFFLFIHYYKLLLEICIKFFDKIPIDIMYEIRDYIRKNYRNYRKNDYYLTLTGEERILLRMNDISPRLAIWWSKNRSAVMKRLGRRREGRLYYLRYYREKREKLKLLFDQYQGKKIGLWGAGLKKTALLDSIQGKGRKIGAYDIINNQNEIISGKEVMFDRIKDEIEVIFVVNPSFYMPIRKLTGCLERHIELINVEDYLNGFIDY